MKAILLLLVLTVATAAQVLIDDLKPEHKAALQNYLDASPRLSFRSENGLPADYRRELGTWFEGAFKINYAVGDFNKDRREDFAVLLSLEGKPTVTNTDQGRQPAQPELSANACDLQRRPSGF